jgi:general nucleoside transport system permease protein
MLGGAMRVGTPFLFVSLGECLTEKSGRINLGLEGVLVFSAMAGFGGAYLSGSPWVGVLAAGCSGALLAALHGVLCSLPRVNDIATGIALMLLGAGLAFYLGKPLIQPQAPQIPAIALGGWSDSPAVRSALKVNALFPSAGAGGLMAWAFANTRWGLLVRMAGDSADAARALGYLGQRHAHRGHHGGRLHRRAGRRQSLSLYYPGSWNEGLSSGQGLIAVALVIFARWSPVRCLGAALLFGGAGASARRCSRVGVSGATTCSTPCPTC